MWGALWGRYGLGSSSLPSTEHWDETGQEDGWVEAEQDCVLRGRWQGLSPTLGWALLGCVPKVFPSSPALLLWEPGLCPSLTPLPFFPLESAGLVTEGPMQ